MSPRYSWLLDDAFLVWFPLIGLLAGALIYPPYRALRGDRRYWVNAPHYLPWRAADTNTWPYLLLGCGLATILAMPSLVFEAMGPEGARRLVWKGPLWIPLLAAAMGIFWWPKRRGPAWYRAGGEPGRHRSTMPVTDAEISAVEAMPDSKRRTRLLRNIAACRAHVPAGDHRTR